MPMTDADLQTLCLEYQRILRMSDWRCSASFVDKTKKGDTLGESEYQEETQSAIITILSETAYAEGKASIAGYDIEHILVHELLHCKFNMLEDENDDPAIEFAIDSTAEALVCLRRVRQ